MLDIDPSVGGRVPPREVAVPGAGWPPGKVKFVVVSAEVVVRGTVDVEAVSGGVSPGALIVDDAPEAEPSCTTS
jgi:hypothetical protein